MTTSSIVRNAGIRWALSLVAMLSLIVPMLVPVVAAAAPGGEPGESASEGKGKPAEGSDNGNNDNGNNGNNGNQGGTDGDDGDADEGDADDETDGDTETGTEGDETGTQTGEGQEGEQGSGDTEGDTETGTEGDDTQEGDETGTQTGEGQEGEQGDDGDTGADGSTGDEGEVMGASLFQEEQQQSLFFSFFPDVDDLEVSLECPAVEVPEELTWHIVNPNGVDVDFTWTHQLVPTDDSVTANGTTTVTTPFHAAMGQNKILVNWTDSIGGIIPIPRFENAKYNDLIGDCVTTEPEEPEEPEFDPEAAPIVSIGDSNAPLNDGPLHEEVVNGMVDVYVTVQDSDLAGYHFRIVEEGGNQGHSCGDALDDAENQGYDKCGYVFNQVMIDSANLENDIIATIDTTTLADGRYEFVLGAGDDAGHRTHADYLNDPKVTVVVNNPPVVSIGNSNEPLNDGPLNGATVSGTIPVKATIIDGDLTSYHFRIVADGGDQGHGCGAALIDAGNQGFGGCGYAYNQAVMTSTEVENGEIASIDTTQLPDGTYQFVLGAIDSLDQRTHSDYLSDPKVTVFVDNVPDEEPVEFPYGEILLPLEASTSSTSVILEANYFDGDAINDDNVQWAVRQGASCAGAANTRFGNVDGKSSTSTWNGTHFLATIDVSSSATGTYCFIFNPTDDAGQDDVRLTRLFTVVDAPVVEEPEEPTNSSETVVVYPGDMKGWEFNGDRVSWPAGDGEMVTGPGTTPLGEGSANFVTDISDERIKLRMYMTPGMQISDIVTLKYDAYRASPEEGALSMALQFDVQFDNTAYAGSATSVGRIVYEPYLTQQAQILNDTWQTWDTLDDAAGTGTGNWWIAGAASSACPQSNPCTWTELNAAYPGMTVSPTSLEPTIDTQGAILFKAGGSWAGFDGNVDKLVLGIDSGVNTHTTTYDFEAEEPVEPSPTDVTIVVTPEDMQGWVYFTEAGIAAGSLVVGPGFPPLGDGSASFQFESNLDSRLLYLVGGFASTPLADINELEYSTYRAEGGPALAVALQLDIDTDLTDENVGWQGRLVYEPYHTQQASMVDDTWQTWDTLNDAAGTGTGNWWFSGAPGNAFCTMANPCTWAEVNAAFPNAGIRSVGGIGFKAGSGWVDGFDGNIDALVIMVGDDRVTYDFEASAPDNGGDGDGEGNGNDDDDDENGSDNSSSRRGGRRSGGGSVLGANNFGEVLGATFCPAALNTYMKIGGANDAADVTKLQNFLNEEEAAGLAVTGIYDQATFDAVKAFQEKYATQILQPWVDIGLLPNDNEGTGYAYKMTVWWINVLLCSDSELVAPMLP